MAAKERLEKLGEMIYNDIIIYYRYHPMSKLSKISRMSKTGSACEAHDTMLLFCPEAAALRHASVASGMCGIYWYILAYEASARDASVSLS
jgi:hypothetical protein